MKKINNILKTLIKNLKRLHQRIEKFIVFILPSFVYIYKVRNNILDYMDREQLVFINKMPSFYRYYLEVLE
jgi:hypothetical protein